MTFTTKSTWGLHSHVMMLKGKKMEPLGAPTCGVEGMRPPWGDRHVVQRAQQTCEMKTFDWTSWRQCKTFRTVEVARAYLIKRNEVEEQYQKLLKFREVMFRRLVVKKRASLWSGKRYSIFPCDKVLITTTKSRTRIHALCYLGIAGDQVWASQHPESWDIKEFLKVYISLF